MSKWILFLFFAIACFAIDESVYEMGTMENPKEDLPYNDDVIVKTLEMPESCPDMAVDGDQLGVHYTGYLYSNGKKFDSSLDRHRIFPVTLGEGRVIKGWEKGLWGMCVEEKRRLIIPAGMAYGNTGAGDLIPPGATLVFDVELIGIRGKGKYANK
ncbi:hypothetical protein WA556_004799, partial [Blastocystis sp. ATCC 50177/Nand II]